MSQTNSSVGVQEMLQEFNDGSLTVEEKFVTRRQLASILGVHMQTVCKFEQEGMPIAQRGSKGVASLYDVDQVRAWLPTREAGDFTSNDRMSSKAKKEKWQAELAQLQYEVKSGRYVPADEVKLAWSMEVAAVRSKLLALPQTWSDKLFRAARLDGVVGLERALLEGIEDVLRELSGVTEEKKTE